MPAPRQRPAGLVASVALHGVLLALVVAVAARTGDYAVERSEGILGLARGGGGGGGGGNRVQYITLPSVGAAESPPPMPRPAPPPAPAVTPPAEVPPEPIPVPEPPRPVPVDTQPSTLAAAPPASPDAAAGLGPGAGPGTGPGTGPGAGGGRGGGTGGGIGPGTGPATGGDGGRGTAPEPRQMIVPPTDTPKAMRGKSVDVTFFVAADGQVDRIAIVPEIRDGGFARKFEEAMRGYRFRPARSPAGDAVAGRFTLTIAFGR